jgi:hypothetical protein
MTTSYENITRQIGDKSVGALERTGDTLVGLTKRVADVRGKVDLPQVKVPVQLAKLQATLPTLPKPREIIEANVELTTRLLAAQNAVTLKVLAASGNASRGLASVKKSAK